ncbi:OadG family protein [Fusibacter tunisiensis]|uniref:Sodium pump decarboxylase gamma subunit n=1 Tax=Fusibacter tunisiensis TaxID=1008308 RepID=A0ABS2MRA6_9FIRM|nr:OadG family protein [Fusibacter tunisiensis]MBM7561919.1 sodium pump decarboxylase gamma subunit [Fusibacter tunisiensis]
MEILELFKHADTFAQMDMGDKLVATLYVILLGMGITFVALVIIMALTSLMSKIIMYMENGKKPAIKEVKKETVKPEPAPEVQESDDEALIAVITAAIAASMNTSMHNVVVSKITRVPDSTPAWGKAGRNDVMASRY